MQNAIATNSPPPHPTRLPVPELPGHGPLGRAADDRVQPLAVRQSVLRSSPERLDVYVAHKLTAPTLARLHHRCRDVSVPRRGKASKDITGARPRPLTAMSSYLINACMRQSPTPDAVARKDFSSAASVTSHAPPGSDIMYREAYYNYSASRAPAPPNVAGFGGMHEKLLGGNGGSIFPHTGFGDPGSPMGYSASGLQYKPASTLHNGLRSHHEATSALTHRTPSTAAVPLSAASTLVDEKSPAALSPPLSSSPGSSPPLAETDQGTGAASTGASDATGDEATASQQGQQQQQQSPTEPLIYPWMRRVHSGHGGKNNA